MGFAVDSVAGSSRPARPVQDAPGVLFVDRADVLGGLERVLLTAMQLTRDRGFRPVLVCPPDGLLPRTARDMGFPVFPQPLRWMQRTKNPVKLLDYYRSVRREGIAIARLCEEQAIAVLHPHNVVSAVYTVHAARTLGIPLITHVHDAMRPTLYSRAAYHYVRDATAVYVSVSQASKAMLTGMGIPESKVRVIYNGVDPVFLRDAPPPVPEVHGPGPHLGVVALVEPIKGQDIALKALASILPRWPNAHLHIIGPTGHPDHKPYYDALMAEADTTPLHGHVSFHGFRTDIPAWLAALDVVLLPTVVPEALPTAIIEAMCLGRKVIGTDVGGTRELIRDGETGRLVPPGDSRALAKAIADLLSLPPEHPMGSVASEEARRRFAPARFGDELADLYRELARAVR